jgi:cytochrome c peroxidase
MQSRRLAGILLLIGLGTASGFGEPARTLKGIPIPQPSATELAKYVSNRTLATAVGKALFWDMQVGSDGVVSCATCHFHAGVDNRSFNQVNPFTANSPTRVFSTVSGPNQQLSAANFPVRTTNVVSSQGICLADFRGIVPGSAVDASAPKSDPIFNVGGRNVRRAEPRNTPTSVGAVFNHRNFWDGRAKNIFNGVSPFGDQDPTARVAQLVNGTLQAVRISVPDSSLASQAVGPLTSELEMSFAGRTVPDVGRKMLNLPILAKQRVSTGDSMLGAYANASGNGAWTGRTYADLIRSTFDPKWWSSTQIVVVNPNGSISFRSAPTGAANEYTQMEYNFSLFFGLAVQLYEAALVPDDSPFDRWDAGQGQLSSFEVAGKAVFEGKGKCSSCHGGAEFTNASVRNAGNRPIERMIMGNNQPAVYDTGFYNIAVRPTQDDIGVGAHDPWGNPLSFSKLFQQATTLPFVPGDPANLGRTLSRTERTAVNGAHKTPTVRNAALTAPYFWNGGHLTLRDVISFYNRGADFRNNNLADLDADIEPLGLSEFEEEALLAFMNALTDGRVKRHAAPFDHPSLDIPLGGAGCATAPPAGGQERFIDLPAVGADGYSTPPAAIADFLGVNQNDANPNQFNVANPVDLNGQFNVNAIVRKGSSPLNGGFDGSGFAYAADELGTSLSWSGLNFVFGPPNVPNGITSKTITVTPGLYSSVKLLGAANQGNQPNQPIRINYTDGSTTTVLQSFSDWGSLNPLQGGTSTYPNQGHARTMPSRVGLFGLSSGNGIPNRNWLLAGYDIAVDPTKAVESITLPNNRRVVILAVSMTPASPVPVDRQFNLAIGKTATQSSIFNANGGPEKAVDGNLDGNFNGGGSVTHTHWQSQPFWQVDLGASRTLSQVKVWNRTDCCADRLANFWVLVSDTPFSSTSLSTARAQAGVTAIQFQGAMTAETAAFNIARTGRYVRIQLEGINYLSLTEVEVFGPQTVAPTVTMTSPTAGASFTAPAAMTLTADATGSIARVEFFNGASKIGEDLSAPYSFSWNGVAAGSYSITARATSTTGTIVNSSAVNVTVTAPAAANQPPTVSISSPTAGASFTAPASVTINATAADADGTIARVEFFNGTTKLGEDLTSPYSFAWTGVAAGTYSITAVATDNAGAATTSAAVSITVNAAGNTPPTVSITSPTAGTSFTAPASVTINATAADAGGSVARVEFFNGATKLGEDLTAPYSFTWTSVAAGSYTITARATDNLGAATTSAAVTISVNAPGNTPPTVSITSPTAGASFTAPASVTINATAADAGGSVTRVEFFNGATKLGEDLTAPYSFTWTNVAAANYTITARATDNGGATTTSAPVNIVVNAAGGACAFPAISAITDNFNRANGAVGGSWSGAIGGYSVSNNQLVAGDGDQYMVWNQAAGPAMEASVRLTNINTAASEIDLLLKSVGQNWNGGVVLVSYIPSAGQLQVWSSANGNWTQHNSINVTLAAGDTIGGRLKADGSVEVYRNGTLIGSTTVGSWPFVTATGFGGVWVVGGAGTSFDDFRAGTLTCQ